VTFDLWLTWAMVAVVLAIPTVLYPYTMQPHVSLARAQQIILAVYCTLMLLMLIWLMVPR